ncbi:MAG: phenylalanine--tRNA ligase subunit beta [Pseudomonadota bacterium]|nr:phenylalanine--tRNA ligase subunit beta [Pseudomonadota bacterium]
MLISLEWLNDYVSVSDLDVDTVSDTLTKLGHEVEGVEEFEAIDDLVVVGRVLAVDKHPNASRLLLCKVDTGTGTPTHRIVCGAPNVQQGMRVALALPGAVIAGQKIAATTIRGEESHGMLCSGLELGISKEHGGILSLDASFAFGSKFNTYLTTQDKVLDVSITPNRGDCLSYFGLARELAAKLDRPLKQLRIDNLTAAPAATSVRVDVAADSGCERFCFIQAHINANPPSPLWMQRRLLVSGIKPINTVVDITNYVMLESGQPSHAYDAEQISGGRLQVKRADKACGFVALDGNEREIQAQDILICDEARVVGLAGIIGGENSEISASTKDIVIEVANFSPTCVRKTAKRLGLHTEAAHRFERVVDIGNTAKVAARIRDLFVSSLPSLQSVSTDVKDIYPQQVQARKVAVRVSRARRVLGMPSLTAKTCMLHLKQLAFGLLDQTDDRLLFSIPSYRADIAREVDLIEEIGRLAGFDKIPYELPMMQMAAGLDDSFSAFLTKVKLRLAACGMRETISFIFNSAEDYRRLGVDASHTLHPHLRLQNPINAQMQVLQTTLLPNLLQCIDKNRRQQVRGVRLFEMGRSYFAPSHVPKQKFFQATAEHGLHMQQGDEQRPRERNIAAGIIDSPYRFASWQAKAIDPDVYVGKHLLLRVLSMLGLQLQELRIEAIDAVALPFMHPYASMAISDAVHCFGYVGELHPRALAQFKLDGRVLYFELMLDAIYQALMKQKRRVYAHVSKYPNVQRDLAFVLAKDITYRQIDTALQAFPAKEHMSSYRLFDIFTGDELGKDKKSVAISFSFQAPDRTLTDAEVDNEVSQLLAYMGKSLEAFVRS